MTEGVGLATWPPSLIVVVVTKWATERAVWVMEVWRLLDRRAVVTLLLLAAEIGLTVPCTDPCITTGTGPCPSPGTCADGSGWRSSTPVEPPPPTPPSPVPPSPPPPPPPISPPPSPATPPFPWYSAPREPRDNRAGGVNINSVG